MERSPDSRSNLAAAVVRLVACWVLAGALFKLFRGSPNDLPPVVREFFLGPDLTFRLAITLELIVAGLALIQPSLGWKLLVLQLVVFLAILVQLVATGVEHCGCFGKSFAPPPWVMLAIDGTALAAVLATRPWLTLREEKRRLAPSAAAIAIAAVAPWCFIERTPSAPPAAVAKGEWKPPAETPRYATLDPASWIGKPIAQSELATWMDVASYDGDTTWILYRITCEHCAAHLRKLVNEWAANPRTYVFVRLVEPGDENEETRQVDASIEAKLPEMGAVAMLPRMQYVSQTPWELELEGGVVKRAKLLQEESD